MRDPNRINSVLETVRRVWVNLPDWRLGQLICNIAREAGVWDSFYMEDEELDAQARLWLSQMQKESEGVEFTINKKTFSNFQDAVDAAIKECDGKNFEIRTNQSKTYDLIWETEEQKQ